MTSSISNYLKKIDIFGVQFQFNIMGNDKFRTLFGFLLSIACSILIFTSIILFGKDFYNKDNPKLIYSNIKTDTIKEITIKPNNFTVAFRIEDNSGNPVLDSYEYFQYSAIQYIYIYNETTQEYDNNSRAIQTVPCTESLASDIRFNQDRNLTEYLCLNFPIEGFEFGGSFTGKFSKYFYIFISNCKNGKCNNIDAINSYLSDKILYFSLYYPSYYFIPNDKNPQKIKYEFYYSQISTGLFKDDTINFKQYFLEDDIGWIFADVIKSSVLAFDKLNYAINMNEIRDDNKNNMFFFNGVSILFNNDYEITIRSYMKIQELSALVGGFMKIIMFIAGLIITPYNEYLMKYNLIEHHIENSIELEKPRINIENNKKSNINLKQGKDDNIKSTIKEKIDGKQILKLQVNNKKLKTIEESKNKIIQKSSKIIVNLNEEDNTSILTFSAKKALEKTINLMNRRKFDISFYQYVRSFIFNTKDINVKQFKRACNFLNKKIDIASYIKITNQFESIKRLILNSHQELSLDLLKRPDFKKCQNSLSLEIFSTASEETKQSIISNYNESMIYYIQKIVDNTANEIDLRIIDNIVDQVKDYITNVSDFKKISKS